MTHSPGEYYKLGDQVGIYTGMHVEVPCRCLLHGMLLGLFPVLLNSVGRLFHGHLSISTFESSFGATACKGTTLSSYQKPKFLGHILCGC